MKRVKNCLKAMMMLAMGVATANHTQAVELTEVKRPEINEELHEVIINYITNVRKGQMELDLHFAKSFETSEEEEKKIRDAAKKEFEEIAKGVCQGVSVLYIKHLISDNGMYFVHNLRRMKREGILSCPQDFIKELRCVYPIQKNQDKPDQMLENLFKGKLAFQKTLIVPCKDADTFKNLLNFHDLDGNIAYILSIETRTGWHAVVVSPVEHSELYVLFDVNCGLTTKTSSEIFELLRQSYCPNNVMQHIQVAYYTSDTSYTNQKKLCEYVLNKINGGVYGRMNYVEKINYCLFGGGFATPWSLVKILNFLGYDCISEMKKRGDFGSCILDRNCLVGLPEDILRESFKDGDNISNLSYFLIKNVIIPLCQRESDGKLCPFFVSEIGGLMSQQYQRIGVAIEEMGEGAKHLDAFSNICKGKINSDNCNILDLIEHFVRIAELVYDKGGEFPPVAKWVWTKNDRILLETLGKILKNSNLKNEKNRIYEMIKKMDDFEVRFNVGLMNQIVMLLEDRAAN